MSSAGEYSKIMQPEEMLVNSLLFTWRALDELPYDPQMTYKGYQKKVFVHQKTHVKPVSLAPHASTSIAGLSPDLINKLRASFYDGDDENLDHYFPDKQSIYFQDGKSINPYTYLVCVGLGFKDIEISEYFNISQNDIKYYKRKMDAHKINGLDELGKTLKQSIFDLDTWAFLSAKLFQEQHPDKFKPQDN